MKDINKNSELNEYIELLNPEEITDELIELFEEFRLEDKRHKNELVRHRADVRIEDIEYLVLKKLFVPSLEDMVIESVNATEYEKAFSCLSEKEQQRFVLYAVHDLTTRQIAELESVSQQAVCKSIDSAKSKMKKYFKEFSILGCQNEG